MNEIKKYRFYGLVGGFLLGIIEGGFTILLGFKFFWYGRDLSILFIFWLTPTFAIIGYLLGLVFERKKREEISAKVIQEQYIMLKKSQEQLIQSEKLAAIGRLAAGIAHEVRNPLSIIKSSASLLQEGFYKDDENFKACEFIINEIDRLNGLITSLLDFAKPKKPSVKDINMSNIIERLVELLQIEFKKKDIEIKTQVPPQPMEMQADPDQLHQAFLTILINAIEAMKDRGVLNIILHEAEKDNIRGIEVSISDNGIGMNKDVRSRLFEPFFTTKDKGTGLGLATVKQIIDSHKGKIEVDSEEHKGATFRIFLPYI